MKKTIFLILVFGIWYLVFGILSVHAASTPTPTPSAIEQQIDELKDKIASRVAQLRLVEKRGVLGNVTDVSDTQITINDIKGNTRFVDVDELTKFVPKSSSTISFGISDIKKGDAIGVLGLYNKQSRRILARAVYQTSISKMIHGYIANSDFDNFNITVAADNYDQFEVSVDTTTKSYSYDKSSQDLVRSGFSKLKVGEKVITQGSLDAKNNKLMSADVIIVFPDITKGVKPQVSPSITPSTGSGKKLTPIVK